MVFSSGGVFIWHLCFSTSLLPHFYFHPSDKPSPKNKKKRNAMYFFPCNFLHIFMHSTHSVSVATTPAFQLVAVNRSPFIYIFFILHCRRSHSFLGGFAFLLCIVQKMFFNSASGTLFLLILSNKMVVRCVWMEKLRVKVSEWMATFIMGKKGEKMQCDGMRWIFLHYMPCTILFLLLSLWWSER